MKQVAALAGVSIATVSRALSGDATVRADRLARVLEAASGHTTDAPRLWRTPPPLSL